MFRRICLIAVTTVMAGMCVSGCSSSDPATPAQPSAKIRLVHASPDAGPVDVYIGTTGNLWLEDLEYGQASVYLSSGVGNVTLVIMDAGADPELLPPYLTESVDLVSGASVTTMLAGLVKSGADEDKVRLFSLSDNFQNSPAANVRTVHAGSDAPSATVMVGDTAQILADNLARWAEVGRAGVPYEVGVALDIAVGAGGGITSFRVPALDAKSTYYFILTGLISGQGTQTTPFNLLIVGPGGMVPLEAFEARDFRLVHSVPTGEVVDAYLVQGLGDDFERTQIQAGMSYGDASAYGLADIRQVIIEVYDAGAVWDQEQHLFSQSVHIHDEAASTTVFVAGLPESEDPADEVRLISLADEFALPFPGQAAVRLVHACPNLDGLRVDFGDDGSDEATMERFADNDGAVLLAVNTSQTMVVRQGATIVDTFSTPQFAGDKRHYLVLTGIKDGTLGFTLLTLTQDGSLGFIGPN